jgi:hypothetical protein
MRTLLSLCLASALAATASATVLVPADVGELARDAVAIVRGRVVALNARWTDDHRNIDTIVTLEVERYLKGSFGPTLQFRVPGGELGRFRSIVVGAPDFAVDEHVVIFLVFPATTGTTRIVRGDASRRPMVLAEFEQRVRALAAGVTP